MNEQVNTEQTESKMDAVTLSETPATEGKGKDKKIRKFLPFGSPIFSRPDREVKIDRKDKNGNKTGTTAKLVANVLVPLAGNVATLKLGVWCDTHYDRDCGGYVDIYTISLPRNQFAIEDTDVYDTWRDSVIGEGGMLDKWMESDAAKGPAQRAASSPRLVKVRKAEPPTAEQRATA